MKIFVSIGLLICFFLGLYIMITSFESTNGISELETSFDIPVLRADKLLSVPHPDLLAVYKFKYKNREFLISSRGGIIEVK